MKVSQDKISPNSTRSREINDEVKAKIAAKFGKEAEIKKPKIEDIADISTKGVKHSGEEGFGDIKNNDPTSEVTQEKLKDILKMGGFNFNDRERKVLGEILN